MAGGTSWSHDALLSPWHPSQPIPLYSSESVAEMMGVKMRGRAAVDDGSVFMVYCPGTKSVKDKMTPLNSNEEGSCSK